MKICVPSTYKLNKKLSAISNKQKKKKFGPFSKILDFSNVLKKLCIFQNIWNILEYLTKKLGYLKKLNRIFSVFSQFV